MGWLTPALEGFGLGGGLIVAIGAQNALVLSHGLRRNHVATISTIGFLGDAALIALAVMGVGHVIASTPWLTRGAAWAGAAFLIVYGAMSLRRAMSVQALAAANDRPTSRLRATVTMLAVTFLNPHVYLDTLVLVGAVSGQYPAPARWIFGAGAIAASFVWFYGLGFGARLLAPLFARPIAWRILEIAIAMIMWLIAASLIAAAL